MLILPGLAFASAMNSATVLAGSAGFTFIAKGKDARPATGVRSCSRSKGSDSKSVALTEFEAAICITVYPSGGAESPVWIAMFPPAPGLASTMTGWPIRSVSHWPMMRARMSDALPGGNPMIRRTGRVGYACALAIGGAYGRAAAPAARCRNCLRGSFIVLPTLPWSRGSSHRTQYWQQIAQPEYVKL